MLTSGAPEHWGFPALFSMFINTLINPSLQIVNIGGAQAVKMFLAVFGEVTCDHDQRQRAAQILYDATKDKVGVQKFRV